MYKHLILITFITSFSLNHAGEELNQSSESLSLYDYNLKRINLPENNNIKEQTKLLQTHKGLKNSYHNYFQKHPEMTFKQASSYSKLILDHAEFINICKEKIKNLSKN